MFDQIKTRTASLVKSAPQYFDKGGPAFADIPDSHSVAVVCSHQGMPLYKLKPGRHDVHDEKPQVNAEPLERYKDAMEQFLKSLKL